MPLVSVIMPSLNVGSYIEKCLTSVMNQSIKDIEIICIDAGSTDGTLEIIKKYAELDQRIAVINSKVRSYGYQVNLGIKCAKGDYIAILETDDWIESGMYEMLYNVAVESKLDYVVADFDYAYELKDNKICFSRYRQFSKNTDMYNTVLLQDEINKLRASDYLLWKGIYNRQFILQNKITLHESPKAAYQDMGFLQQVKTYAQRAMYIDKSFYRYRMGRVGSSTCSLNGMLFYMNEFMWINNDLGLLADLSDIQETYYFYTMSVAFYYNYCKILFMLNWNYKDECLSVPYQWFSEQLKSAIHEKIIYKKIYDNALWLGLNELLDSEIKFAIKMKCKYEHDMEEYLLWEKKIENKKVLVFGCGLIGSKTLRICDIRNITIEAFVDNNIMRQQDGYNGYSVISVEQIKELGLMEDYVIILAVKNDKEKIINQLRYNEVICEIVDYPIDVVLM